MQPAYLQPPARHLTRFALAVLVAGFCTTPAVGQPIRLIPPGGEAATEPAPAEPPSSQGLPPAAGPMQDNTAPVGSATVPQANGTAAQGGEFVIQQLRAPDPSSAGLLDDSNGGLGTTMWQGTSRRQATQALSVLPAPVAAPALRDLQRRLLLTTAEVPEGEPGTPSLLGLRVAQLYRLGETAGAEGLATPKPAALNDPIFLQMPVDAALLQNDIGRACEMIAQGLREDGSAYWQKATVFCRYQAKDIAGGDLALSLWRDGGGDDPAFIALAGALRGDQRAKLDALGSATSPLHFAALRATGRPVPKEMLEIAPPPVLAAIAVYDKAEPELRLTAAERAARFGALSPEALAEAYGAIDIPEGQRAALASGKDKSARAAAYLYQAAKAETKAGPRADLLRRAYELAVARGLLLPTAAIYRPLLSDLSPDGDTIAAAPAIIRLALAAGETGMARLWHNQILTLPPEQDRAADIAAQAWPLLLLAGAEPEWRDSRYEAWLATQEALQPEERNARAALLLTLIESAGVVVPAERWDALLAPAVTDPRHAPAVAVWRNLLRASETRAKAESVALALALLGPEGTATADAQSLATALGVLRGVGLNGEARQIALEAALLRDF